MKNIAHSKKPMMHEGRAESSEDETTGPHQRHASKQTLQHSALVHNEMIRIAQDVVDSLAQNHPHITQRDLCCDERTLSLTLSLIQQNLEQGPPMCVLSRQHQRVVHAQRLRTVNDEKKNKHTTQRDNCENSTSH